MAFPSLLLILCLVAAAHFDPAAVGEVIVLLIVLGLPNSPKGTGKPDPWSFQPNGPGLIRTRNTSERTRCPGSAGKPDLSTKWPLRPLSRPCLRRHSRSAGRRASRQFHHPRA